MSWEGNRNSRAALTGALIGAHLADTRWEATRDYDFGSRYDQAIHSGVWAGFGA